jgi:hypothetical protein
MVQWTEKLAAKPQISAPKQDEPQVPYRAVRKPRKSRLAGALQVLSVCAIFGLIVGYFVYKEKPAATAPRQTAQQRDLTTGRIVVMDETQCRELDFDNQSGRTVQKGQVSCHQAPGYDGSTTQSLYRHPTNRLESIRRSFTR